MFQKTGAKFKVEEFVEITLTGQEPFEAVVFLSVDDRLIDLLNDQRQFIPVKRMDNSTVLMAKSNIVSIVEKDPFAAEAAHEETTSQDVATHFDEDEFEFEESESAGSATGSSEAGGDGDAGAGTKGAEQNANAGQKKKRRRRRKKSSEFDAYAVLKVSPDASLEEIRKAYKSRIKAVHPDSVAALDLDEDLVRAAIATTQRVNFAYHRILKEHKSMDAADPSKQETRTRDAGEAA